MNRRDFLAVTAAVAATSIVGRAALGQATSPAAEGTVAGKAGGGGGRPNILFVFSDEHRWCSLPFTESPHVVAPHMTRFAKEGMRFDNCCATSPICTPYRGMLLTGRWPHESSCISNDYFGNSKIIGKEGDTIAHTFKKAGYVTGYVGKWHLDEESVYDAGFDTFKHWLYGDDHWNSKWRDVPSREEYKVYKGYNAIGMTDQALAFLEEQAKGGEQGKEKKPFLLMLSLNPPHYRWDDAPPEHLKHYPKETLPFRPNVTRPRYKTDPELSQYQHYHGHITAVDVELGRIMESLKKLGLEENTVVIYTSDHGSSFGSNNVGSKGNPFDEAIRVPLLVRWPGHVPAGKIADHNVGTVDLHATLCGFAGITPPKNCPGVDFSPVMLGKPGPDPASQLILVNNFQRNYFRTQLDPKAENIFYPYRGVRTKRYTYAVYAEGEWLLYDNQKDPYQQKNLVADPAYADVRKELRKELDAWLAKAEDPFIPAEWTRLPLHERIALENRHYSLLPHKKQWDTLKAAAVAPYLGSATAGQKAALQASADKVYDEAFFGRYKALHLETVTEKRNSKRPIEEIRAELAAHEKAGAAKLKEAADAILAGKV